MNVRLAVQLLSNRSAKSMRYLEEHKHTAFLNCIPTANFTEISNNVFDIFNTKDSSSKTIFKNAINQNNAMDIFNYLDKASEYFQSLKIGNQSIMKSKKRTGIFFLIFSVGEISESSNFIDFTGLI